MAMVSLKKQDKIPVHVVDNHNDALNFILKGIGSKRLSFGNNLLIHFDSHPDLLLNDDLSAEDIFNKEILLGKVSIETWILPLTYAEHVNEIVWIKPFWCKQIDDGTYTFYIGETKDKLIKVSEPILYFISALNYAPFEELLNPRKIIFHVMTLKSNFENKEDNAKVKSKILKLIKEHDQNLLLDIDLDFFYTLNPFIDMHEDVKMYERLKVIYSFAEEEISQHSAQEALIKRKNQIDKLNLIFETLENKCNHDTSTCISKLDSMVSIIDDVRISSMLKELIIDLNKIGKIDWDLVHNAGTTIDDHERVLPHHPSSESEIESYIQEFERFVSNLPNPKMITIARSSSDDYCPESVANELQNKVCTILTNSFSVNMELHYEEIS